MKKHRATKRYGQYIKIGIFIFTLAAIISAIGNFAAADVIHLKNGDKISGNVTLKDGMVTDRKSVV